MLKDQMFEPSVTLPRVRRCNAVTTEADGGYRKTRCAVKTVLGMRQPKAKAFEKRVREIVTDNTCTSLGVEMLVHRGCGLNDRPLMQILVARSDFLEVLKHRVDHFKGLVDLLSHLGASQDNLAADEDQKHNFRLDHSVDETREQLRLVRAEVVMA
jgi:hypothetical protein